MTYRRRASALHAARARVAAAFCAGLLALGCATDHPIVLGAVLVAVISCAGLARVGRELGRAALFAVPLALLVVVANALVVRDGLTVVLRGGDLGFIGRLDVTAEAIAYGGVLGLRAVVVILACALMSLTVDPDEVLGGLRRFAFGPAVAAALSIRLVPVLARDARRMAAAQSARPSPPGRIVMLQAIVGGAIDRSLEVAAALEVRGFARGRENRARPAPRPASRHDLGVGTAAAGLWAGAAWLIVAGPDLDPYPALSMELGPDVWILVAAVLAVAVAPLLDRRGV